MIGVRNNATINMRKGDVLLHMNNIVQGRSSFGWQRVYERGSDEAASENIFCGHESQGLMGEHAVVGGWMMEGSMK